MYHFVVIVFKFFLLKVNALKLSLRNKYGLFD